MKMEEEIKCQYCKNGILLKKSIGGSYLIAFVSFCSTDGSSIIEYCTNCNYEKKLN